MIDMEKLLDGIDLRQIVARDLGAPHSARRMYDAYRCPLHGEQKGYSLIVRADRWRCYGKCQTGGNAIGWMQQYHRLTFLEACERLTNGDLPRTSTVAHHAHRIQPVAEPPDAAWQAKARQVIDQACQRLWSKDGQRAMAYLKWGRGLHETTIAFAELGYIPGSPHEWRKIDGLNVPCGIVIPWTIDGAVWGVKVRRAAGDVRYQQVAGGNVRGCLFMADRVLPGFPVLVTEGEFDALIAHQVGGQFIRAVAIGSAANARIDRRWFGTLLTAPRILVRMDADDAGAKAARELAAVSGAVRAVQVPHGKDVNDFYLSAGDEAVEMWLRHELNTQGATR